MANLYKFIYEANKEATRKIYGAVENEAGKNDPEIIDLEAIKAKDFKLVYEKDGVIYGSLKGVVSEEDEVICEVKALYEEAAQPVAEASEEEVSEEEVEEIQEVEQEEQPEEIEEEIEEKIEE